MSEFNQNFSKGMYLNVGYKKEDIVTADLEYCPNCSSYNQSYRVEGFADPLHRKAVFCGECGFLIKKPVPFKWRTFPGLKVLVHYSGKDRFIVTSNDYGEKFEGVLPDLFYHYSNYDDRFHRMKIVDQKNEDHVLSYLLACEDCHEESIIKFLLN